MLALDWDMRTAHTSAEIAELLCKRQGRAQLSKIKLKSKSKFQSHWEKVVDGLSWVSSMFVFETVFGRGLGMLRLTQDGGEGIWKPYAIYTSLQVWVQTSVVSAEYNDGAAEWSAAVSRGNDTKPE